MTDGNNPADNGNSKGGRPKVNRDLAFQLLQKNYSNTYIKRVLKCSDRTLRNLKKELEAKGIQATTKNDSKWIQAELELDDEAKTATGIKLSDWLKSKTTAWKNLLNYIDRTWNEEMNRISFLILKDAQNQTGDEVTLKLVQKISENPKSSRARIISIRYLYRFLGRADLLEKYLRVTQSKNPIAKREVSVITSIDFPLKVERCFAEMDKRLGSGMGVLLKLKLCTGMRTGSDGKEFYGLKKDESHSTFLIMHNEDEFYGKILAKRNEVWILNWLPKPLRADLYKYYQALPEGARYVPISTNYINRVWKQVTKEIVGVPLRLHDLRKINLTWLWVMKIPLEVGTDMNVGWKDLNTAKGHYLTNKRLLTREAREKYRANIPEWYKEGLDQFRDDGN